MLDLNSFFDRIQHPDPANYLPIHFRGHTFGAVAKANLDRLRVHADMFELRGTSIELIDRDGDYTRRSQNLDRTVRAIYEADRSGFGLWCPETTPVVPSYGADALFDLQRAAVRFFGVLTQGVHLNVYFTLNGITHQKLAIRAPDIASYPGLLDQAVAGFLPIGHSPRVKLVAEAHEEAGLDADLTNRSHSTGSIEFAQEIDGGLQRGAVYVFDLEVDPAQPLVNQDGEVSGHIDVDPETTIALLDQNRFKFDSALVTIDFLLRHGHLNCENMSYLRIRNELSGKVNLGGVA